MSEGGPADRDLVSRIVTLGDPAAFHTLYTRHGPALYAMAVRLTGNSHDAEDVTQDAWIRATERLDRFLWKSALRTWLIGIVVNCARELRRDRSEDCDLNDAVAMVAAADFPQGSPDGRVESVDLDRAITAMPMGYREVVILHDIEGFTHQEIGTLLGIDPGTSKSQLARGRRWLRRALEPDRGIEP